MIIGRNEHGQMKMTEDEQYFTFKIDKEIGSVKELCLSASVYDSLMIWSYFIRSSSGDTKTEVKGSLDLISKIKNNIDDFIFAMGGGIENNKMKQSSDNGAIATTEALDLILPIQIKIDVEVVEFHPRCFAITKNKSKLSDTRIIRIILALSVSSMLSQAYCDNNSHAKRKKKALKGLDIFRRLMLTIIHNEP